MSEKYAPKAGDRVRVVYEGVVGEANAQGFTLGEAVPIIYEDDKDFLVSVEKIEPPVTIFKPGDRIKRGDGWDFEITLADDGYLHHFSHGGHEWRDYAYGQPKTFNSERFELVYRP